MYLYELRIQGFRRFEDLRLRFKNGLNVIVGPNNAGTSQSACRLSVGKDLTISMAAAPAIDQLQAVNYCFPRAKPSVGSSLD